MEKPGTALDTSFWVVEYRQDGVWLLLRYVAAPGNPEQGGTEEMVFAEDILDISEKARWSVWLWST
jgi:hypothetical protein